MFAPTSCCCMLYAANKHPTYKKPGRVGGVEEELVVVAVVGEEEEIQKCRWGMAYLRRMLIRVGALPAPSSSLLLLLSLRTAVMIGLALSTNEERNALTHVSLFYGEMVGGWRRDADGRQSVGSVLTGDRRRGIGPACTSADGIYAGWAGEAFDVLCRIVKKKSCRQCT